MRQNVRGELIDVPLSLDDEACCKIINLTIFYLNWLINHLVQKHILYVQQLMIINLLIYYCYSDINIDVFVRCYYFKFKLFCIS